MRRGSSNGSLRDPRDEVLMEMLRGRPLPLRETIVGLTPVGAGR